MAISLIAPGVASALANLGAPPGVLPDAASASGEYAGFADLLSMQLLDLGQPPLVAPRQPLSEAPESTEDGTLASSDPALQWLAGLSIAQPPTTTSPATNAQSDPAQLESATREIENTAQKSAVASSPASPPGLATTEGPRSNRTQAGIPSAALGITIDDPTAPASWGDRMSAPIQATIQSLSPTKSIGATSGNPNSDLSANLAAPAVEKHDDFLATLHAQVAHQSTPATQATASRSDNIPTPLRDAAWAQDFSERVVWLARNDQQRAQISINPPQLGPLQISLNMNGDQATASFVSPHAEVRQAIEDALPRLREMLAGAGIDLGQANVGSQLAQQSANRETPDTPRFTDDKAILPGDSGPAATAAVSPLKSGRGLVDLFA